MKYCRYCGAQLADEAVLCVYCGCQTENGQMMVRTGPAQEDNSTMKTIIKVFMIIGCVAQGWLLIPLAWCIPMTVSVCRSLNNNQPISTGMKVCSLLFVNLIAGICMLCMNDQQSTYY